MDTVKRENRKKHSLLFTNDPLNSLLSWMQAIYKYNVPLIINFGIAHDFYRVSSIFVKPCRQSETGFLVAAISIGIPCAICFAINR